MWVLSGGPNYKKELIFISLTDQNLNFLHLCWLWWIEVKDLIQDKKKESGYLKILTNRRILNG